MVILGLQGSPRKKGNTSFLLSQFLQAAEQHGARTRLVHVVEKNIQPCKEYVVCEKKGTCPIDDDMGAEVYGLLREAEIVVLATPIFFYNMTSQLKALVDRCQTFWARKYRLKLSDPLRETRRGYLLSVGATRGKNLFEGLQLTAKYFFDAIDARFEGSLVYRGIEGAKDMARLPTVEDDVRQAVAALMAPFSARRKILFLSRNDACRSQIAGAFCQRLAGGTLDVATAGTQPAAKVNADMVAVMREKGIDMAFRTPHSSAAALDRFRPDIVVSMGGAAGVASVPAEAVRQEWALPDPAKELLEGLRRMRDDIEARVRLLIETLP
jgi:multimeric flavodoxin WrbA/protein-tyrosine-phosphatase